jgi:hypothetical protein
VIEVLLIIVTKSRAGETEIMRMHPSPPAVSEGDRKAQENNTRSRCLNMKLGLGFPKDSKEYCIEAPLSQNENTSHAFQKLLNIN